MAVDYEALAKQFGGSVAPASNVDFEALAKQFGGTVAEEVSPRKQMQTAEIRRAAAPFAGFSKGVGDIMFGGQRLVGKGLRAIGAEETGQALVEDAARRQAEQEAFIAPYKQVSPAMTGAGELTGQVIGTLPVGGVIARGVQPLSAPVAQAIRTGGFSTGAPAATTVGGRAADLATRAAGGAVVGGTSAALISPEDTTTGAAIGAAAPMVLPTVGRYLAIGGGKIIDAFTGNLAKVKAGQVAREMAGDTINQIRVANKLAPVDISASQAVSGIDNDVYQAFLDFYAGKDKSSYFRVLKDTQKADQLNRLAQLAGGPTMTENLTSVSQFKNALNNLMTPIRETELAAANVAGTTGRRLQQEADILADAATGKVQDVRRFVGAIPRAEALAKAKVAETGMPATAIYNYPKELAKKADEMATQAAEGSLRFGEAARFKQAAADSLKAYGLKPLTSDSILSRLGGILRNPEFAGNDVIEGAVRSFGDDVVKWTNADGVIDGHALDSLRKHSVNAAIEKLRPGLDQTSKKNLAAKVITQLKQPIENAIEEAGGTGYGQYLRDYAANAQLVDRRRLAGKALEMFKKSPDEFQRLVQGDNPDAVEAVFGPGSFNVFKEMGADIKPLQQVADELARDAQIVRQVKSGRVALQLEDQYGNPSEVIPGFVGWKTAVGKKVAQVLFGKVNEKAQAIITEGTRSGKAMNEILNMLPAEERSKAIRAITEAAKTNSDIQRALTSSAIMTTIPPANALAPEQQNQNALAR